MQKKIIETTWLACSLIEKNEGQIEGLPANPRLIRDEKFQKLCDSIKEQPEMLSLRELLVFPYNGKYVIIGGNMRFAAMQQLGYTEAPCKIIPADTPVATLKAYTIKDNNGFGDWDWNMLANEWDSQELNDWGLDVWQQTDVDVDDFFNEVDNTKAEVKGEKITITLPADLNIYKDDIISKVKDTLAEDYQGCKVS